MRELKYFLVGGQFGVSQTVGENGLRSTLADFLSDKVCQRIGRRDFLQAAYRKLRRLVAFFI
jgi:hypothetical protein